MDINNSKIRIPLQISKGVIIVPIRYEVTHFILETLKSDLLDFVSENKADAVIFDLKGVEILDAEDFKGLNKIIKMIKLMGLNTVLCGLSPGIVASIVSLDVDLRQVKTTLDLNAAMDLLANKTN